MAALHHVSCSMNNLGSSKASLAISRRNLVSATTSSISTNYQTKNARDGLLQLVDGGSPPFRKAMFQDFSLTPMKPILQHNSIAEDEETVESETEIVIGKLKTEVERLRQMEVNKFMGRVRRTAAAAAASDEEISLSIAEQMSKEIVAKFLEKPIRYLENGNGNNLEERVKEVNCLVGMLQDLCRTN